MRLKNVRLVNFASYDSLEFDFDDLGLVLVHGPSGSGKSTLQEAAPWILTGETSKGGNVDEIRSWNHPKEPTKGILEVDDITVTRVRGRPNENDFYWTESNGEIKRGKDITETQKLLYARLSLTYDALITGSTFNEFSNTGSFFTAKGKDRRELFETLADLSLPVKLTERIKNEKSIKNKRAASNEKVLQLAYGKLSSSTNSLADADRRADLWSDEHKKICEEIADKAESFSADVQKELEILGDRHRDFEEVKTKRLERLQVLLETAEFRLDGEKEYCDYCDQPSKKYNEYKLQIVKYKQEIKLVKSQRSPYLDHIAATQAKRNIHIQQLEQEHSKINPFLSQKDTIICDIGKLEKEIKSLETSKLELEHKLILLDRLQDLTSTLRIELLRKTVYEVQEATNRRLDTYFDSEFKVGLELKDGDSVDVSILKGSHEAVYKQLSRGQRCILRLCFVLAVQSQVANKHGIHFECLFFDEILDGCDENLKNKAYRVFEDLSIRHKTILLTDHNSEFKNLFSRRFKVTLEGDVSTIKEE